MSLPFNINLRALALLVVVGLCLSSSRTPGEMSRWRLGGQGGEPWGDWANMTIMVDDSSVSGAIQPFELDPEENFILRLGPWQYMKFPDDPDYRPGHPRIWWGVNQIVSFRGRSRVYVDGDSTSFVSYRDWNWGRLQHEFDTIDLGAVAPVERFVFYPPKGTDGVTDEPYRPNFVLQKFELSGGQNAVEIQREQGSDYRSLEVLLAHEEQNFDPITEVRFPLQYYRFLRFQVIGDGPEEKSLSQAAIAEMEVYGRGFVPEATYESRAVDLGQEVNFGRVYLGVSRWRKEAGVEIPAPEAPVVASVEIKSGRDDSPRAFFGYNDQGEHDEVTQAEYQDLKPRFFAWDPPQIGWRGPVTEDQKSWSFWSVPLRQSGTRPGLPPGRYFQLRIRLQTQELWAHARIESLAVEVFPLLADEVVAELGVVGDLTPEAGVAKVEIGERTEFLYALKATFAEGQQSGFDAVRIFTPSEAVFNRLEMGEPLAVVEPDSVGSDGGELAIYLPQRVDTDTSLRIGLGAVLYGGSAKLEGEVFDRGERALGQRIEEGDASEQIGTNRLQVVASGASLEQVLAQVALLPPVFTPNQDGRNDRVQITYTLFGVQGAEVEIEVYTLAGRRVRHLSARQPIGFHAVEWEGLDQAGRRVAPGLYLCRVKARTEQGVSEVVKPMAVVY